MGAAALMAVSFGMLDDIKDIKQIIKVDKPTNQIWKITQFTKNCSLFSKIYTKTTRKLFAALNG